MENKLLLIMILFCLKYFAGSRIPRRLQTTYLSCACCTRSFTIGLDFTIFVSISPICPTFYLLCHTNFESDNPSYNTKRWGWAKKHWHRQWDHTRKMCSLGKWQLTICLQMSCTKLRKHINLNRTAKAETEEIRNEIARKQEYVMWKLINLGKH